MSPNSIRELTCRPCGQSFMGKKGSRVCGECQARRKAAAQRRYYEKHRQHRELCLRVTRAEERVDELGKIMAAYMERERSRDTVPQGALVDVEYILGIRSEPKLSEAVRRDA